MIITIASLKGGVGKSTICQNLAVCFSQKGYKTAIIDTDTNQSCMDWIEDRDESLAPIMVAGYPKGKGLMANINMINKDYEIILIDGSPALNELTVRIIAIADLLIIPIKAGLMDIRATQKFIEYYEDAVAFKGENIPAYFLLNEYKKRLLVSQQTEKILRNSNIKTLSSKLGNRTAFNIANGQGLGAFEYTDRKAKREVALLTEEVETLITQ